MFKKCQAPFCVGPGNTCSWKEKCPDTSSVNKQYAVMVAGIRQRRMVACESCKTLFDPEANIPSAIAPQGLCSSCEQESLNALADRLQQDTPAARLLFGQHGTIDPTELPLAPSVTPPSEDVIGQLLNGEDTIEISFSS
jgi:hypothetical protein